MIHEKILFTDSLGTKLVGILSRSQEGCSMPLVILCHGFTSNKDRDGTKSCSESLYNIGFATFRYDAYGHGESAGDLGNITITKAVDGCMQAVKLLQKKGFTKIGLMGSSFGGCVVLNVAYQLQDNLFAVCAKAPVSDYALQKRQKLGEQGMKDWKASGYMTYTNSTGEKSREISYNFYHDMQFHNVHEKAKDIDIPICIAHGDKDVTVLLEQSILTHALLPHAELHIFSGTDHFFRELGEQDRVNLLFTNYFLKQIGNK